MREIPIFFLFPSFFIDSFSHLNKMFLQWRKYSLLKTILIPFCLKITNIFRH